MDAAPVNNGPTDSGTLSLPSRPSRIHPLPKDVVDRIAAGEVVQRPASVVKELIENSLDAGSTTIDVQLQGGGLRMLTVTDDGCGISPPDLQLAATRFATSKLVEFDDLRSIRTFGFRGEALSSASMVGRLSITSRRRKRPRSGEGGASAASVIPVDADEAKFSTACAYKQSYRDGLPTSSKPSPSVGREGTVVRVEDLFYNVPSRRRAFFGARKESEEYSRVLSVSQRYAVHRAGRGIGFVCRKKGGNADLNTPSIPSIRELRERRLKAIKGGDTSGAIIGEEEWETATRDSVGHVFGSSVAKELLTMRSEEGDVEAVSHAALEALRNTESNDSASSGTSACASSYCCERNDDTGRFKFAYKAFGLMTNGSFCTPKASSAFVLFINDRLVESAPLRRAVESVYADSLPRGAKPFVYLSLELPGPHVDVNVHPTKREVAFLHEDRLCDALASATREVLGSAQTSRTFYAQAVLPVGMSDVGAASRGKASSERTTGATRASATRRPGIYDEKKAEDSNEENEADEKDDTASTEKAQNSAQSKKRGMNANDGSPTSSKKPYDPKRLVRTIAAAPAGALEPFLVRTQAQIQASQPQSQYLSKPKGGEGWRLASATQETVSMFQHAETCELYNGGKPQKIDMTIPGAFASICRCQVERGHLLPPMRRGVVGAAEGRASTEASGIVRPKRITPTETSYFSIQTLRADVTARAHRDLSTKLRDSTFVGCVSRHRSLIQWGLELLMISHTELGRELFYQLALARFGGAQLAELGGEGVNVHVAIERALQLEEDLASGLITNYRGEAGDGDPSAVRDTNTDLAAQATKCLSDKAQMLEEYFSIRFVQKIDSASSGKHALMLTGLPVLLDGHSPSPHALPLFLLRLATEVDYTEERRCFEGVCTELGAFYADVPYNLDRPEETTDDAMAYNSMPLAEAKAAPESEEKDDRKEKPLIDEAAKNAVKHILYPALSSLLVPPKDFANDGTIVKLALLSSLYKVFERC